MRRALLTWSDAGIAGRRPSHHVPRSPADRGPVLRLLDQDEAAYDLAWVLTIPGGEGPARELCEAMSASVKRVEIITLPVDDPSDYKRLFEALGPLTARAKREILARGAGIDVLLSAGTPQAQTLWVILVQAGLLPARMLQVIPPAFVPVPHPRAVREVRLDIEGFPEIRALREEISRLRAEAQASASPLLGQSEVMVALRSRLARVAASEAQVLILGETGTGKELLAQQIHASSARASRPFVAENCGVFTEGVLQSELFGHEAGAFTGASRRRRGVFEQAHGGTLFLDEVGELSPRVQAALLRVLQDGALRRVGGEGKVEVDVRIISATHRDLAAMVREGSFREDLYYRLRGATLEVPPLRARPGDVELLVEAFLADLSARRKGSKLRLTREAMRVLSSYSWAGNVRELKAEVMRWGVFCDEVVDVADLSPEIRAPAARGPATKGAARDGDAGGSRTLREAVEEAERAAIAETLGRERGNLARTARALGIDRNTLKRKVAAYGLRDAERAGEDEDR